MFGCLGMGFLLSILYIFMMSRCANCLAFLSITVIEICLAGGTGACFFMRTDLNTSESEKSGWLVGGICLALLFCLFNLALCCLWRQIRIAIAVIDATADFFAATYRIVLVSLSNFVISLIVILLCSAGLALVMSLNEIKVNPSVPQGRDITWNSSVTWMMVFMGVGLIWLLFFLTDKTGFVCMVAASSFYFSSNAEKTGSASVMMGVKYAYFKHMGSLAFGSFIHTAVWIVKVIVESASKQANKTGD